MKNKIGVTLVELIVVMAIVAIISVIGIRMFKSVNRTQSDLSFKILLQMQARKAFSQLSDKIRESTTVIRPTIGESLSFLVVKDITNNSVIYYLEPNNVKSKLYKQKVYKLVMYLCDYSGKYHKSNDHVILDSVKSISFSSLSPKSVLANVSVVNEKGRAQFISRLGLLNTGGSE